MAVYRRPARQRFVLVVVTLLSVTIITLDQRGQTGGLLDTARGWARDAVAPLQSAADAVFSPVTDAVGGIFHYGDLQAENRRLREQLAEARVAAAKAGDSEREVNLLRELDDLPFATDVPSVVARVVSAAPSNFELTIQLDKGTSSGVAEGMPVVAGGGLVGSVVEASRSGASVLLLTDPTSSVGVRLGPTGEVGVAQGRGARRSLRVDMISPGTKVHKGDVMTTSGLQLSRYPPGIPVGRVARASARPGDLEQSIALDPLVDMSRLALVKVLQYSPELPPR